MQLTQAEDSLHARHNLAPVEKQVMKVACALGTHHTGAAQLLMQLAQIEASLQSTMLVSAQVYHICTKRQPDS